MDLLHVSSSFYFFSVFMSSSQKDSLVRKEFRFDKLIRDITGFSGGRVSMVIMMPCRVI